MLRSLERICREELEKAWHAIFAANEILRDLDARALAALSAFLRRP